MKKIWISPFGIDIPTLVVLMVVSTIKSLLIADNFLPRLSSDTKLNGKGKNGGWISLAFFIALEKAKLEPFFREEDDVFCVMNSCSVFVPPLNQHERGLAYYYFLDFSDLPFLAFWRGQLYSVTCFWSKL